MADWMGRLILGMKDFNKELSQTVLADASLEAVVGALLLQKGCRLSVAESCTGGRIASRITRIPGSSRYFESGCITYSNASKTRLLAVPTRLLEQKGAVSAEVAQAMAEGLLKREHVDLALSVTGIAGPGGGRADKPVGRVYIALSDLKHTRVTTHHFKGDREKIQSQAAQTALEILKNFLST